MEAENATIFFQHCNFCNESEIILVNDLENIDQSIPIPNETNLVDLLLYGDEKFNDKTKSS